MSQDNTRNENDVRNETIKQLHACHDFCTVIFLAYSARENKKNLPYVDLKKLHACMELCQITADFLLQHLPMADKLCEICAAICGQWATYCEATKDPELLGCADICRQVIGACMSLSFAIKDEENGKPTEHAA